MANIKKYSASIAKSFASYIAFSIIYVFIFYLVFMKFQPLIGINQAGYPVVYVVLSIILQGLPFVLCNYLIMLARNSHSNLRAKNFYFALVVFFVNLFLITFFVLIQLLFPYYNIINGYIMLHLTLLRSLLIVELPLFSQFILLYFSAIIVPIYLYIGGSLRIKHFERGEINE